MTLVYGYPNYYETSWNKTLLVTSQIHGIDIQRISSVEDRLKLLLERLQIFEEWLKSMKKATVGFEELKDKYAEELKSQKENLDNKAKVLIQGFEDTINKELTSRFIELDKKLETIKPEDVDSAEILKELREEVDSARKEERGFEYSFVEERIKKTSLPIEIKSYLLRSLNECIIDPNHKKKFRYDLNDVIIYLDLRGNLEEFKFKEFEFKDNAKEKPTRPKAEGITESGLYGDK
ncbi:hypothetical protein HY500_03350 [Candidatus Woesearchaeota archaeon]|nr:hypothetical protein [Candidatus Woesearchaeota archaeon]